MSESMAAPPLRAEPGLLRTAAGISAWNSVSRITGFVRVLAVGAALGTTFVGNTYQSANLVSNLLFELLAAGLLSAPLVPAFVALIDGGDREEAVRLAGSLLGIALAVLGGVVVAGMLGAPLVMRALTMTMEHDVARDQAVRLGSFFLWFFLPQVLVYAVLAVATALLNADRHFRSGAMAPIANNVVVIATMVAFVIVRTDGELDLDMPMPHRLLLAVGTTAGVLAMAAVPLISAYRRSLRVRPRWAPRDPRLREIARVGLWGGVVLGAVQVLIAVTVVVANHVPGGVVAYQIAFTFFLLPVALVAHPIYTSLYPRLAATAQARDWSGFAADVTDGVRRLVFMVIPAAAVLVAAGAPAIRAIRMGELDPAGARLVGRVLAAYAMGLAGYSCFLLLTRAWTAAGNARLPAAVAGAMAAAGGALMVLGAIVADGGDRVVALGVAHSAAMTGAAAVLLVLLARRYELRLPVSATVVRSTVTAVIAAGVGAAVADAVDSGSRASAAAAAVAAAGVVVLVWIAGQWALRAPELRDLVVDLRGRAA